MPMLAASTPTSLLRFIKALPEERQWPAFTAANPALASELGKLRSSPRHILGLDVDTAVEAVWWLRHEPSVLAAVAGLDTRIAVSEALTPLLPAGESRRRGSGSTPEERTSRILAKPDPAKIVAELARGKSPVVWEEVLEWVLGLDEHTRGMAARALVARVPHETETGLHATLVTIACAGAEHWSFWDACSVVMRSWRGGAAVAQGIIRHGVLDARVVSGIAAVPDAYDPSRLGDLPMDESGLKAVLEHVEELPAGVLGAALRAGALPTDAVLRQWGRFDDPDRLLLVNSAPDADSLRELLARLDGPDQRWGPEVSLMGVLERLGDALSERERGRLLAYTRDEEAARWLVTHPEDANEAMFRAWPLGRLFELLSDLSDHLPGAEAVLAAAWEHSRGLLHVVGGSQRHFRVDPRLSVWVAARLAAEVEDRDWALVWENMTDASLTAAQVVATAKALRD